MYFISSNVKNVIHCAIYDNNIIEEKIFILEKLCYKLLRVVLTKKIRNFNGPL